MTDETQIRVIIVEDYAVVRAGLVRLLQDQPDIQVVADTEFGEEAIQLVQEHAPNVVLLDLLLETSQIDGLETLSQIVANSPTTRVVVLSVVSDEAAVFPAINAGAMGYVLKKAMPGEVVEAIRDAANNRYHLDPTITRKVVEYLQAQREPTYAPRVEQVLTPRERDMLPLIAQGMSNPDIAEQLHISRATVKTHVSNILRKLDIEDRARLAMWWRQQQNSRLRPEETYTHP